MTCFSRSLLTACCMLFFVPVFAQQLFSVTDSSPATAEGLQFGYNIVNEKEKEVGDKGNFSRFSLNFFITNTGAEAKMLLYKPGFNLLGNDVSPTLVQFKCLNATGARLTSKEVLLQAKACTIMASVEDKDCASGKTMQNKRMVQVGYWIKPGETISARTIVIVPLNERPDVKATLYSQGAFLGSAVVQGFGYGPAQVNDPNYPSPQGNENFIKIRNTADNSYLNIEGGLLQCSSIKNDWWSAQWQIMTIKGTRYYRIKNRWKELFLCTDNNGMLCTSETTGDKLWGVQPVGNTNMYMIQVAGTSNALVNQQGHLLVNPVFGDQQNALWIIEQ